VIYLARSVVVGGEIGASRLNTGCATIPDDIFGPFPTCSQGKPLASLRIGGVTTQFNSRITQGKVVGSNGVLIAENPDQFYTGGLNNSLAAGGVTCLHFFSGTQPSGLAHTGNSQCSESSSKDFFSKDEGKYRTGSCTSTSPTWFSGTEYSCKEDDDRPEYPTTLVCVCTVAKTPAPSTGPSVSPTRAPKLDEPEATIGQSATDTTVTAVAWGLVGILSAVVGIAGVLVYFNRSKKPTTLAARDPHDGMLMMTMQSTDVQVRNTDA